MGKDIPAKKVLAGMAGLLKQRYEKKIGRITFLRAWGKFRSVLSETYEYKAWRKAVYDRAGGACEECADVGHDAHHIKPMATHLHLALDLGNGRLLCKRCHGRQPGHRMPAKRAGGRERSIPREARRRAG